MYTFKGKFNARLKANSKYNSKHPLYDRWLAMMQQCYDYMHRSYARFGKVGIRVDERWHDFDCFVDDISPVPEKMVLSRISIEEDFGPANFIWLNRSDSAKQIREISEWLKSIRSDNKVCA
jgi:hypothetical protein